MKTTIKTLRRIIREELQRLEEVEQEPQQTSVQPDYAKKVADKLASANEGGIGLLTRPYGTGGIQIVIYKTNVFIGNILANLNSVTKKLENTQDVADAADSSIVGMLTLDKPDDACNDALVVKYVVSRGGYGPMLYEVGMQLSPSGRIISDRGAVSDAASSIYKVFHSRSKIDKKPLDDNNIPMDKRKTPNDPSDDCEVWNHEGQRPNREFLDYSFGGSTIDIGTLKKNHRDAMMILKRHVDADEWSEYLAEVSNMIFTSVYHKTPMSQRGLKQ